MATSFKLTQIELQRHRYFETRELVVEGAVALDHQRREAYPLHNNYLGDFLTPFQPAPLVVAGVLCVGTLLMAIQQWRVVHDTTSFWLLLVFPIVIFFTYRYARSKRRRSIVTIADNVVPVCLVPDPVDPDADWVEQGINALINRGLVEGAFAQRLGSESPAYLTKASWTMVLLGTTLALMALFGVISARGGLGGIL